MMAQKYDLIQHGAVLIWINAAHRDAVGGSRRGLAPASYNSRRINGSGVMTRAKQRPNQEQHGGLPEDRRVAEWIA